MKHVSKLVYLLVWGMGSFWGCSTPEGFKSPEDPLDAGREFIRALLDGDY